jgi:hypothetical protein
MLNKSNYILIELSDLIGLPDCLIGNQLTRITVIILTSHFTDQAVTSVEALNCKTGQRSASGAAGCANARLDVPCKRLAEFSGIIFIVNSP